MIMLLASAAASLWSFDKRCVAMIPAITALAPLAHQADDRFGGFRFTRAALRAIDMRLVKNHQSWPPKVAWQVDERLEKKLDEAAPLSELQFVGIDHRRDLVLEQPAREQRGVARIGRQFSAGADQQDIDRFAQTRELTLVVQHDGLDPGALCDQAKQPRFTAARIGLNEKAGIDQRREIELQLLTGDDLPDNHGLSTLPLNALLRPTHLRRAQAPY